MSRVPAAVAAGLAAAGLASGVAAQPAAAPAVVSGLVVAATPIGSSADPEQLPFSIRSLGREELELSGAPGLLRGLERALAGITLQEAQANPFQPNLVYRGFEASPLAGAAQGLAVYVNGIRFNQPFGDTVNWDLIPDGAAERAEIAGANPAFGLNALGGALTVRLKDGFGTHGGQASVSGGAFGRIAAGLQYGAQAGSTALYLNLSGLDEDGWRDYSPSRLRQAYADLGWREGPAEVHLSLLAAHNDLTGNGAAPVQLLAADRRAVFTQPDETANRHLRAMLSADYALNSGAKLEGRAYVGRLNQNTRNGDLAEVEPCDDDDDILCLDDGPPLQDGAGAPIASAGDGPYALLNRTTTRSTAYGAALQLSDARSLFGRANRLAVGVSFDGSRTGFTADSLLGGLSQTRAWTGPGTLVAQPDGAIAPVSLRTVGADYAVWLSDTWRATERLSLTAAARFDAARLNMHDRIGTELNGRHRFDQLNGSLGLTYKVASGVSAYAGYARSSRAPTPAELSCAEPTSPCSLANFFVADPPLEAVTAGTFEGGLRGRWNGDGGRALDWNLGLFRSDVDDDIQLVASGIAGRGYFANVGATRRQGVEAGAGLRWGKISARADYAYTAATYRRPFVLNAGDNPALDEDEPMLVPSGAHRPGIPAHSLKLSLDYAAAEGLEVGASLRAASGQYLFGDEANLTPKTRSYAVIDARASYRLGGRVTLFGEVRNLLDARYETFGAFSAVEAVPLAEAPGADNPRSLSPGAPRAAYGGVRVSF